MHKRFAALLAIFAVARVAHAACEVQSWNQKWFDSDALHYTAADLDGDNVPEIISASTTTVVYRRPPEYAPFPVYTSTAIGAPVAGDVTGDGKVDLVIPNDGNDTLVVLPGNGNGTFNSAVVTSLTVSPARMVLGNFSGNAQLDVALIGSNYDSPLIFLQGNGAGAFTQVGTVAIGSSPFHLAKANFDGDGYDDVAVSRVGSSTVAVVFANGSGGSAATISLDGGTSALLAAGDYDGDNDTDLYSVRPSENRLDVFSNSGSRTFAAVVSHPLWSMSAEAPRSIALADFDNDLDLDLAIGRPGYVDWMMRTPGGTYGPWFGGNFNQPHPWRIKNNLRSIAAADFNGDGRIDLAVENEAAGLGGVFLNECGKVGVNAGVRHVITLGQATEGNVTVHAAALPQPTGTVKISWDGGEKTVTLPQVPDKTWAFARYTIEGLPLGFQPILAEYSGDATYPPAKNTTWITVTNDTTTTTLTGPTRWTYGQTPQLRAEITSSTGDTVTGDINYYRNGDHVGFEAVGEAPVAEWNVALFPAGTHTIKAALGYSETHPPSDDSIEVTIDKAASSVSILFGTISRAGEPARIEAEVKNAGTGQVRLMEGGITLDTDGPITPDFVVSGLALGTHTLRVVWDGDANVNGSSLEFVHTVLPANTVLPLVATGGASSVRLEYLRMPAPPNHSVQRRVAGGPWAVIGTSFDEIFIDHNVVPGTAYQYRIEVPNGNGGVVQSNVETVYVGTFTDPTLNGLKIKKTHFNELQTALNTFRTMASQPLLQINFTGKIQAAHLTQLRNAINDARTALGMAAANLGANPVAGVTRVRATDLHQLRDALR